MRGFLVTPGVHKHTTGDILNVEDIGVVFHAGITAPENKKLLWIDTGNESTIKYWNGSAWVATHALWAR